MKTRICYCLDMRLQSAMFGYLQIGIFVSLLLTIRVEGTVYLGCYKDSKYARVLPNMLPGSASNTPEECARRCSDYRYAGVEFWTECYCGHTLNATQMPESECKLACHEDKNKKCGGFWMISIYTNLGTETVLALSTTPVITTNSSNHGGSTTAVYVGIGGAIGLLCAVGAVVVIIVLRRRGALSCKTGTTTDTTDNTTAGSLTLAIRSYEDTGEDHNNCVKSEEGTFEHYNTADELTEGYGDTDHYYSTEITEEPYERMKDGNDDYNFTTNTLLFESNSRERDNIYNKLKIDRPRDYDHFGGLEHNVSRPRNDYDTTDLASSNEGVGDYNHIPHLVGATVTRENDTNDYAHGDYDVCYGKKINLTPCDSMDYAHAKI